MFNLRDLRFRRYFLSYINAFNICVEFNNLYNKEEVTDRDLLEFYFKYSELSNIVHKDEITSVLFNYKMEKSSKENREKFFSMVENKTGVKINWNYIYFFCFKAEVLNHVDDDIFSELIDIFLDEV